MSFSNQAAAPDGLSLGVRRDKIWANIIDYGILGLLVFSPLPAASVREWAVLVIQVSVVIMMAAYVLMREKPTNGRILSRRLKWPKYLFSALAVFLLLQIVPFPSFLVRLLSPSSHHFQKLYSVDASGPKFMSFSIVPSHTLQAALELLTYFLIGFLVIKTVTRKSQVVRMFSVVIAMGVFEALYGLFELYNSSPRILFYKKVYNLDSVTGTFVNRNHFSGYLEMIIPLALGLVAARIVLFSPSSANLRRRLAGFSEGHFFKSILISLGIGLMALAVVFSRSRSGVSVLVLAFILFAGLVAVYFNVYGLGQKRLKNFLGAGFLLVILLSLFVGINATLDRFSLDELLRDNRPAYWSLTLRTFADFPLLGTGLGTYGALVPSLEGDSGPVAIVHAHNDFLEYLSELGVVGFSLLFGGVLLMVRATFLSWRARRHPEIKGLALGGMVSVACIMIHSLTDFNLHIPANIVLLAVVLPSTMVLASYKQGEFLEK
jgi:O-antigen ligase